MYRVSQHQMSMYDYLPPYHGELVPRNRWIQLADAIDWDAFEEEYSQNFGHSGKVAIPARIALGSLIIRAAFHISDRQTVDLVRESPYLQYFLGFETFTDKLPFSARSMEKFRARIPAAKVREAVRLLRSLETLPPNK